MGYKLAGFEVLGGVEIDPEMMGIYRQNHKPKISYLMGVQDFKSISEIPDELMNLDVLDGSPPCSSFSVAGSREDAWGEKKKFREGQAHQVLDDLFFHFIDVANRLRPKVVISENVKGLIMGKARGYVKEIFQAFNKAGYDSQLFLLNASRMGVPQARERTFFVSRRKDLKIPKLVLEFQEKPITVSEACEGIETVGEPITAPKSLSDWKKCEPGFGMGSVGGFNSQKKLSKDQIAFTQTGSSRHFHWDKPNKISDAAVVRLQTFPDDFNFGKTDPAYVCGMSVPPFMMERVAREVAKLLKPDVSSENFPQGNP